MTYHSGCEKKTDEALAQTESYEGSEIVVGSERSPSQEPLQNPAMPTIREIRKMLPVTISDLRLSRNIKQVTIKKVKRALFLYFVREMYDETRFFNNEKLDEPAERIGCFIKGYVRDIWTYMQSAYDLCDGETVTKMIKQKLAKAGKK